jgi:hypothetical protein
MIEGKPHLSVFYCVEVGEEIDESIIAKCLYINIKCKMKDYNLIEFKEYKNENKIENVEYDKLERGLYILRMMYKDLKLKNSNETWFVYISRGKLIKIMRDIGLLLLSKDPGDNKCYYCINKKHTFEIPKTGDKESKLNELKYFTKSLDELFICKQQIRYKAY